MEIKLPPTSINQKYIKLKYKSLIPEEFPDINLNCDFTCFLWVGLEFGFKVIECCMITYLLVKKVMGSNPVPNHVITREVTCCTYCYYTLCVTSILGVGGGRKIFF